MRPPNSALPVRDACSAWSRALQQRRAFTSATIYPGYGWSSSSSASSSSSPCQAPLSLSFSASGSKTAKSKPARRSPSLFALPYSTSNPAYPLPGSNNEIDPRGVDYSLFEAEDDTYLSTTSVVSNANADRDGFFTAPTAPADAPLSAPTQLLVRLINQQEFEAATTVLTELKTLKSPLDEPLPIYATAALWAIQNGKKKDMLSWMRLCPGYLPGTKYLHTASKGKYSMQVRSMANQFRKCFMVLLDSYGDDLRLLQQASMIAAQKGFWGVLQSTLAQILRFGVGRTVGENASNPDHAWEFFHRLLLANQSQRGLKEEGRRQEILSATRELRALFNLGIRTLALAGRSLDAIHWASKSVQVSNLHSPLAQILVVEPFTESLLMEELVKAGPHYFEAARQLAEGLSSSPARLSKQRRVNIDAIVARVEREANLTVDDIDHANRSASALDSALQHHLEHGDVVAAREYLLSVLRSVTRVRKDGLDNLPLNDLDPSNDSAFDHLPSARILSELQDVTHKLGTIAVTSSLTETDMHQPCSSVPDSALSQETFTAEDFLRPVRNRLLSVRGGKGLWETARLYGFVKKGRWKEAVYFYAGKAGFKLPSGGISNELVSLALDQQSSSTSVSTGQSDQAQSWRGKHWPSTHAINLVLKAITNICVEANDFARLQQVYGTWKEASLPRIDPQEGELEELTFEQWPPSQRPSSHTFDPFLRAFGRLDIQSTSTEAKANFGSSQLMLDVLRDMTDTFHVRPSISSWTIAIECLAREGRSRWESTTEVLARAMGINTGSFSQANDPTQGLPPASLGTYTALMRALVRVPHSDGGSMLKQVAAVRDDLLLRTLDLDLALRSMAQEDAEDVEFWKHLLKRWQTVQEQEGVEAGDERRRWSAEEVLNGNRGRTGEVLREVWLLEEAAEVETTGHTGE